MAKISEAQGVSQKSLSENPAIKFFLSYANWFAPVFFIIALLASLMLMIAPMERANVIGGQYDAYWIVLQTDLQTLDVLERQFFFASPYLDLSERGKIALVYSRKAKDAIATWDAFKAFANSNGAVLKASGADTARFVSTIDEGKLNAKLKAGEMAQELRALSGTNKAKIWITAPAIASLEELAGMELSEK